MSSSLRFPVPSRSLLQYLRRSEPLFSSLLVVEKSRPPRPCRSRGVVTIRGVRSPKCQAVHRISTNIRSHSTNPPKSPARSITTTTPRLLAAPPSYPPPPRPPPPPPLGSSPTADATSPEYTSKQQPLKLTWKQRLFGGYYPSSPEDPEDPDSDEYSVFNTRRTLTAKAALEPRLRCTEVDDSGHVILVDGEFKKSELIAKYGLLPRDLRKIDSSNLPHILVRPSAILLNLLHLKVLIKHDRVLLFDVYGSKTSYPQSSFMYDLQGKLQQGLGQQQQQQQQQQKEGQNQAAGAQGQKDDGPAITQHQAQFSPQSQSQSQSTTHKTVMHLPLSSSSSSSTTSSTALPYEFRALEAVLLSVCSELEADFETVRDPVIRILSELEDDIDRHKLRVLLILSKRVSTFEQKAKLVRDAIEELLEADDDLAAMYLTEKAHDLVRGEDDHTEVEMLLESYHKLCDEIVQESGNLVNSIRNTEEM
ncbi:inner membrane magnesium transporter MRS2 [Zalerion maritima]|uniref:Magnesium transporter n=1 Tax=Zalerion maritima TaxID=339359 RepID=A0AAD5WMJ8_9PEZI|nr:inner membrane magnesium transporter MRS2 [Zalerion maritima]